MGMDGLDRALTSLIPPIDQACLVGSSDDEDCYDLLLEHEYWCGDEFVHPELGPIEWVIEAIRANPGIWTAELCRRMNGIASDNEGIAYCGMCRDYANPRKRQRAPKQPTLPGFENIGGAFQLHDACATHGLRRLRYITSKLAKENIIEKRMNQRIPDIRQARGWDFGTRLYIQESD